LQLLNVGHGNFVSKEKMVALVKPDSSPIKRLIQESRDRGLLIDATQGKKTQSVIITDCGMVVLSALSAETLEQRNESVK